MARRLFDRYMIALGIGRNDKLAGLTDSEFRAHVVGVLAIAAKSPVRGYLLVAEGVEATAEHIANQAGGKVTRRIAQSAMDKLVDVGVLLRDDEMDAWRVHDWDEVNPPPKRDETAADRQRRHRAKVAAKQGRHAPVTATVTPLSRYLSRPLSRPRHAYEVEVEVEDLTETYLPKAQGV